MPLPEITEVFAATGIILYARAKVEQVLAGSPAELVDRVVARSLSNLARLPDALFQKGLRMLRQDEREGRIPQPIVERLDLVVFRAERAGAG